MTRGRVEVDVEVDGRRHDVTVLGGEVRVDGVAFPIRCSRDGTRTIVSVGDRVHVVDFHDAASAVVDGRTVPFWIHHLSGVEGLPQEAAAGLGPVRPPMSGRIDRLLVGAGDEVAAGDVLFVLEAMKMRNEVKAPADGRVAAVHAAEGDTVDASKAVLELVAAG